MQNFFNLLVKKWAVEQGIFKLCTKKKLLGYQSYPVKWMKKVHFSKKLKNEKNLVELGRRYYTAMESFPFWKSSYFTSTRNNY